MINKFLQYIQYEKSYSFHTVLSYHTDLNQFCQFLEVSPENFSPDQISFQTIQNWILYLSENNNSARSISRKISTLKSFWKFLLRNNLAKNNPTLKIILPKTKKTLPVFYKQGEINAVLHKENSEKNDFNDVRDNLIINLLYQTGVRVSELINIRESDIDFSSKEIKIIGKGKKTRIIPIGNNIAEEITKFRINKSINVEKRNNYLIVDKNGEPVNRWKIYNIVHNKMSAVSTMRKQSPHVFRHTFATTMLNNGAEINTIKELLGHSSLAATQVYTHTNFKELNDIYKQAHPRAIKKGGKI